MKGNVMDEKTKDDFKSLAVGMLIYCTATVVTNVAVDLVRTKVKQRRARKEAAANLALNED
jgi:hypothetical protein